MIKKNYQLNRNEKFFDKAQQGFAFLHIKPKFKFALGGVHKLRLQDLGFFDHLPPSIYIFYGMNVYKKLIFLTIYPPPLVKVVCERPPTVKLIPWNVVDLSHLYLNAASQGM